MGVMLDPAANPNPTEEEIARNAGLIPGSAEEAKALEARLAEVRMVERAQREAEIASILTPEQIEKLKAAVSARATTRPSKLPMTQPPDLSGAVPAPTAK